MRNLPEQCEESFGISANSPYMLHSNVSLLSMSFLHVCDWSENIL